MVLVFRSFACTRVSLRYSLLFLDSRYEKYAARHAGSAGCDKAKLAGAVGQRTVEISGHAARRNEENEILNEEIQAQLLKNRQKEALEELCLTLNYVLQLIFELPEVKISFHFFFQVTYY